MSTLYRQQLIDHWKQPRHATPLADPTRTYDLTNRSCGDTVKAAIKLDGDTIVDLYFGVEGCALAVAAASALAEHVVGTSVDTARQLTAQDVSQLLGGVEPTPSRMTCLTLGLQALHGMLA